MLVFEKVNTGGKPLDAFELVTAMYAGRGYPHLRDDWLGANGKPGLQVRLATFGRAADQKFGVLEKVANTERSCKPLRCFTPSECAQTPRRPASRRRDLPPVRAIRQSLLGLPLDAYREFKDPVEAGYKTAARFLREQNVHRVIDLPYQAQLVPLAAILAELRDRGNMSPARPSWLSGTGAASSANCTVPR